MMGFDFRKEEGKQSYKIFTVILTVILNVIIYLIMSIKYPLLFVSFIIKKLSHKERETSS